MASGFTFIWLVASVGCGLVAVCFGVWLCCGSSGFGLFVAFGVVCCGFGLVLRLLRCLD